MAILTRDFPDMLLDAMVLALETFRDEQVVIDPTQSFEIERDRLRPYPRATEGNQKVYVNLWVDDDLPDEQDSGAKRQGQTMVTVNVDLVSPLPGSVTVRADKAAGTRLHYLRAQVREGLYRLANADFGFDPGIIARKKWPRWQTFQTQDKMPEEATPGGRLVIEIEYEYAPGDITAGPALELLTVEDSTHELWKTEFDYTDT